MTSVMPFLFLLDFAKKYCDSYIQALLFMVYFNVYNSILPLCGKNLKS